jgi:hypothetical protein
MSEVAVNAAENTVLKDLAGASSVSSFLSKGNKAAVQKSFDNFHMYARKQMIEARKAGVGTVDQWISSGGKNVQSMIEGLQAKGIRGFSDSHMQELQELTSGLAKSGKTPGAQKEAVLKYIQKHTETPTRTSSMTEFKGAITAVANAEKSTGKTPAAIIGGAGDTTFKATESQLAEAQKIVTQGLAEIK